MVSRDKILKDLIISNNYKDRGNISIEKNNFN